MDGATVTVIVRTSAMTTVISPATAERLNMIAGSYVVICAKATIMRQHASARKFAPVSATCIATIAMSTVTSAIWIGTVTGTVAKQIIQTREEREERAADAALSCFHKTIFA